MKNTIPGTFIEKEIKKEMDSNPKSLAHFIWIGEQSMPLTYQKCFESFCKLHPYWRIKVWTLRDIEPFIQKSKYDFNKFGSFINRYNFIKYHILAEQGGWFVDMDIEWKKPIDQIYTDKLKNKPFPDLFIPVRSLPGQTIPDIKSNDDMLMFAKPGILNDLLEFINIREDIDISKKYEPYGPVSLSTWLHQSKYSREYLYETEIQNNGYYCNHLNGQSWRFY